MTSGHVLNNKKWQIRRLQASGQLAARNACDTTGYANPPCANTTASAGAHGSAARRCGKQVGSDLSGVVFFKDGEFLNFSTPNKDFTMHLGGWVQWDNVWWNQPPALQVAQGTSATGPSIRQATSRESPLGMPAAA